MKKIAIITFLESVALQHKMQLETVFGSQVEISVYAFDKMPVDRKLEVDLAVISIYPVYVAVEQYLKPEMPVVIINTTITQAQYDQIMAVPAGERVMIVNYSREMTIETLAQFKNLGIRHIELIPYYPEMERPPKVRIAITPGEAKHVPAYVPQVIDIGNRVLAGGSLVEIALKLGLGALIQNAAFVLHLESLMSYSSGMQELLGKNYALEGELQSLLDILEDGIVAVDVRGTVHALNKRAEEILQISREEGLEKEAAEICGEIPFQIVLEEGVALKNRLLRLANQNVRVTVVPVKSAGYVSGALAMLREFSAEEQVQYELRAQILNRGYRAKYVMSDIVGQTPEMSELKNIAAHMAVSDGSVLIIGESGTGKELFAQAIHNASGRRGYPFVAVNCAALPESLLESELFGYEEGAFTGARKGGKPGLFEMAHQGTLFLDEIGEMALHLQSRLLRVLQEREVTRLGGDGVIGVDIRLISATNMDLMTLVHNGKFRRDLYYRLNVLPLKTIPLRNRLKDIPLLVRSIQKEIGADFKVTEGVWRLLMQNPWEGNVRELHNAVEYMAYLRKPIIQEQDLRHLDIGQPVSLSASERTDFVQFDPACTDIGQPVILAILALLYTSEVDKRRIGRRSIVQSGVGKSLNLSESQCRRYLKFMEEQGWVSLRNGNGGTCLTQTGKDFYISQQNRDNRGI